MLGLNFVKIPSRFAVYISYLFRSLALQKEVGHFVDFVKRSKIVPTNIKSN